MARAVSWSLRALAVPSRCPRCFYSLGTVAAWGFPGRGVGPGQGSCFAFFTRFDWSRAGGGRESSALVPPGSAGRDGATRPFPPSPHSSGFACKEEMLTLPYLNCKLSAPLLCTEGFFFVFVTVNTFSSQCILQRKIRVFCEPLKKIRWNLDLCLHRFTSDIVKTLSFVISLDMNYDFAGLVGFLFLFFCLFVFVCCCFCF